MTPLGLPYIHLHWTMRLHISYILLHHSVHCLQHYIEINCTWLLSRLYSLRGQYIINALAPRINTAPTHKRDNDNILTDNKFKYICNFLSILKLIIVSVKHFCVPRQILSVFLVFISLNFHKSDVNTLFICSSWRSVCRMVIQLVNGRIWTQVIWLYDL